MRANAYGRSSVTAALSPPLRASLRRYQRGTLRLEGRCWVLRIRGEAADESGGRPERSIRIGLVSEYKTRQAARLEADRRLALQGSRTAGVAA